MLTTIHAFIQTKIELAMIAVVAMSTQPIPYSNRQIEQAVDTLALASCSWTTGTTPDLIAMAFVHPSHLLAAALCASIHHAPCYPSIQSFLADRSKQPGIRHYMLLR